MWDLFKNKPLEGFPGGSVVNPPTQETRVQSLSREDPTRGGAVKPVWHNSSACALEPRSRNY